MNFDIRSPVEEDLISEYNVEKYVKSEDLFLLATFVVMGVSLIITNIYARTKSDENIGKGTRYLEKFGTNLSPEQRDYIQKMIELEKTTTLTVWCTTLAVGIFNISSKYQKYFSYKCVVWG